MHLKLLIIFSKFATNDMDDNFSKPLGPPTWLESLSKTKANMFQVSLFSLDEAIVHLTPNNLVIIKLN